MHKSYTHVIIDFFTCPTCARPLHCDFPHSTPWPLKCSEKAFLRPHRSDASMAFSGSFGCGNTALNVRVDFWILYRHEIYEIVYQNYRRRIRTEYLKWNIGRVMYNSFSYDCCGGYKFVSYTVSARSNLKKTIFRNHCCIFSDLITTRIECWCEHVKHSNKIYIIADPFYITHNLFPNEKHSSVNQSG